ncbi:MAG: tetratricopeptide repeat protein [Bacteroidales bacterium]|jgi:serine phosphatase RsbU (regulator of sigma subunit)|nr:tetratricopeptide repeat protein [Bacteroidales bacterium]
MKRIFFQIFIIILASNMLAFGNQKDSLNSFSSKDEAIQKINQLLELSETKRNRNPEKSIEFADSALKIAQEIESYEVQYKAEFSIGFANYKKNDFRNALIHLENSLSLSKKAGLPNGEALALNRIGNTYQLLGQNEEALEKYMLAMTINKVIDNKQEIARTLTNLGSIYRLFGNYELAINKQLEALGIYEEIQNKEGIAWSALNIARLFKFMKNYQKSLEYVNKSLSIYQKVEDEQGPSNGVTLCLKEKGNIYYEMGNLDKAVEYSIRVLEINKGTGNMLGISHSLTSLGKIYFEHRDFNKAYDYLSRANAINDSLNNDIRKASILRYLGKIYLSRGETSKAREYLIQGLEFAEKQNLKEEIKESYFALSELYQKTNNPQKALDYFKMYTVLKEELDIQKINELELQFEFGKKQRLLEFEQKQKEAEQMAKLQKQKIFTWLFVAGFLFMIILAYVIFMSYQRKKKTNIILTKHRDKIARQNTIITDSIEYAKRIQSALFPQEKFLKNVLSEYFIYMKPKNIVSGDFYWVSEKDDKVIITVSDCTGHGVPGAFMSMLGIAFLNEIVNKSKNIQANEILEQLRDNIIDSLHQEYGVRGSKDGMDMALCVIDKKTLKMQYSGAYNSVFVIRQSEIHEIKADKMPIGIHAVKVNKGFVNQEFDLEKNDVLYLFSDGYVDQFGGAKGSKFKQRSFKELLVKISEKSMDDQKKEIKSNMNQWQGDYSQLDDMMIMGVRI